jgi:hypothetical protein
METGEVLSAPGEILEKDRFYNCGHRKRTEGKQDDGVARRSCEVW